MLYFYLKLPTCNSAPPTLITENIVELVRMPGLSTNNNLLNILFLGLCRIVNTCKWLCAGAGMIIHISKRSKFFTITNNCCVTAVHALLASFYVFMFIIVIPKSVLSF